MAMKSPDAIDIQVGQLIRGQRLALGMSQSALAEKLGLTFQQVQKYEKGWNRVGSSRLVKIADALGVEPSYFFPGNGKPNNEDPEALTLVSIAGNGVRVCNATRLDRVAATRRQKKKSRSWAFRSALPCLRKRTSSASSAQNSLQKNWPLAARQGCSSPFTIGSCLPQNAQRAAASVPLVDALIKIAFTLPMPSSRLILRIEHKSYLSRSSTTVAETTHIRPKRT